MLAACVVQVKHTAHDPQLWANVRILLRRSASASLPDNSAADCKQEESLYFKDYVLQLQYMVILQRQTPGSPPVRQQAGVLNLAGFMMQGACPGCRAAHCAPSS